MKTLIVPCAGGRIAEGKPLYLNRHPDGKLLAEKAIEGIFPETYDRIVYTILSKADKEFDAKKILLDELQSKYGIEVLQLEKETNGPAETVHKTIENCEITGEFAVRDSLNWIDMKRPESGNFIIGLDLSNYEKEIAKVRTKSFIMVNEQHQILDIVEKKLRSDIISVGYYGFKDVKDFNLAYFRLNSGGYPIEKLYMSHVISYLIGYKHMVFHCEEVRDYEEWANKESWQLLQKSYSVCFIDLDRLVGKINNSEDALIEGLISLLKSNSKNKMSFVLFTSKHFDDKNCIINRLKAVGVNCMDVICGMPYTNEQFLVQDLETLQKIFTEAM